MSLEDAKHSECPNPPEIALSCSTVMMAANTIYGSENILRILIILIMLDILSHTPDIAKG